MAAASKQIGSAEAAEGAICCDVAMAKMLSDLRLSDQRRHPFHSADERKAREKNSKAGEHRHPPRDLQFMRTSTSPSRTSTVLIVAGRLLRSGVFMPDSALSITDRGVVAR
jgi:hypothetical protein